uniref:Uncharacterized protein n=1 Tax=Oryza meridionalis TaxID=40149 RepID=A0A0E0DFN6_9ORYZ
MIRYLNSNARSCTVAPGKTTDGNSAMGSPPPAPAAAPSSTAVQIPPCSGAAYLWQHLRRALPMQALAAENSETTTTTKNRRRYG